MRQRAAFLRCPLTPEPSYGIEKLGQESVRNDGSTAGDEELDNFTPLIHQLNYGFHDKMDLSMQEASQGTLRLHMLRRERKWP